MDEEETARTRMAQEEQIKEKTDAAGHRWRKVYYGGGAHFRNWLEQFVELWDDENVEVEEVDSSGMKCYEEGGEKMCRIWVKDLGRT